MRLIMLLCVYVCMSVFLYVGAYAFGSIIFHYTGFTQVRVKSGRKIISHEQGKVREF